MSGCQTCGGYGDKHDEAAHGLEEPSCITDWYCLQDAHLRFGECLEQPDESAPWHCICGSGDDAEFHSIMCVGSNTPEEVWRPLS